MSIDEAVALLRKFNLWRRYPANFPIENEPPMPDPYEVGEAIDVVCDALSKEGSSTCEEER